MRHFILLILFLLTIDQIKGQTSSPYIKGVVIDKISNQPLSGASVSCYRSEDSIRQTTTISDKNGLFAFDNIRIASPYIIVSFIGYKTQIIKPTKDTAFRFQFLKIPLEKSSLFLSQIEVKQEIEHIKFKGDTIQFDANMYKVSDEATISSLLKKLPGFKINPDGSLTFNGQQIKKLLINGRTYFGNDIRLALQNIPAGLINKIQLFETRPDETLFSADRTLKEQTINLTIKEEKTKKIVGQISGGYGFTDRFAGKATINRFTTNDQISIIGNIDNMNGYLDDMAIGTNNLTTAKGGFNYSGNIKKNMLLSISYKYDKYNSSSTQNINRKNFLSDSIFYYNQKYVDNVKNTTHTFNIKFDFDIDSSSKLSFNNSVTKNSSQSDYASNYNTIDQANYPISEGSINTISNSSNTSQYYSLGYLKMLNKKNRQLSIFSAFGLENNDAITYNLSNYSYNKSNQYVNQYDSLINKSLKYRISLSFSEPILPKATITIAGGFIREFSPSDKKTFDYDSLSKSYVIPNDSLGMKMTNTSNSAYCDISLRGTIKKIDLIGSVRYINSTMNSTVLDNFFSHNINLFLPALNIYYNMPRKSISFNYTTKMVLPTFTQFNPIPDNSNNSIRRFANNGLKPGTIHNFQLQYSNRSNNNRNYTTSINGFIISRQIIDEITLTSEGIQVIKPVNVNGSLGIGANMSHFWQINKNITIDANIGTNYSRQIYSSNGLKSTNTNYSLSSGAKFNYSIANLVDINIGGTAGYGQIKYPKQNQNSVQLISFDYNTNSSVNLSKHLSLGVNWNYSNITQNNNSLSSNIANIFLSNSIIPQRLIAKLYLFDVFNSSSGILRQIGANYVEDTRSNTFGRTLFINIFFLFN